MYFLQNSLAINTGSLDSYITLFQCLKLQSRLLTSLQSHKLSLGRRDHVRQGAVHALVLGLVPISIRRIPLDRVQPSQVVLLVMGHLDHLRAMKGVHVGRRIIVGRVVSL